MKKASILILLTVLSAPAMAQKVANEGAIGNSGMVAIAAAIVMAIAAIGGAMGQGKIGAAAMEGLARNPKASKEMFVPMILGLVLIESLVIYGLVIAFKLTGLAEFLSGSV